MAPQNFCSESPCQRGFFLFLFTRQTCINILEAPSFRQERNNFVVISLECDPFIHIQCRPCSQAFFVFFSCAVSNKCYSGGIFTPYTNRTPNQIELHKAWEPILNAKPRCNFLVNLNVKKEFLNVAKSNRLIAKCTSSFNAFLS